jgi:hypothetical protein
MFLTTQIKTLRTNRKGMKLLLNANQSFEHTYIKKGCVTLWPCLAMPFTLLLKKDLNAKKNNYGNSKNISPCMHACKKILSKKNPKSFNI